MAVFLSPGVFPREVDLSALPTSTGPLRPGFVGVAKKGPMNTPVLITGATQFIDTFGEPFPESYLGYAVLSYLEEADSCYIMRVGVECEEGQPSELSDICIDTSGARTSGWGRIPLFSGIDHGKIDLREIGDGVDGNPQPYVFHASSISNIDFNDADVSSTDGPTTATLNTSGSYTGAIDDSFVMIITGEPNLSDDASVAGAEFQIVRGSDGEVIAEGVLTDDAADGTSQFISLEDGYSIQIEVTGGVLDVNDTFTWNVTPDNRVFKILVDGEDESLASSYTMPSASYSTVASFISAANSLLSSESYLFVEHTLEDGVTTVPQIRSSVAGDRVQLWSTEAWALEVGSQKYAWDIPRSFLLGLDPGPNTITTSNNRVSINVVGDSTKNVAFSLPSGVNQTTEAIASVVDAAGVVAGETLWNAYALTVPGGATHLVIETSDNYKFDTLELLANFSNIKTLRFAEEFNFAFPYKRAFRGFYDNRTVLPASGESDPSIPLSCENDALGEACLSDTSYYSNIVGWLVAPSAGTWVDNIRVSLSLFTSGVEDSAGKYTLSIEDAQGNTLDVIQDISFDKRNARYIGNIVNPGSSLGGTNGNSYVNWEERPAYLNNNTYDLSTYAVRLPSQFNESAFTGSANGIPLDPAFSSELDAAVIGNPATATGLYAFQNPESIDINLLLTPGFSTGAVIGTALQICESRGDILYIVDPPFGLRPQQAVDWHNGMLLSDLRSAINSSYGALYWGWLRTFDQFNNIEIWVPPSGHVAAIFSRTARETEQWQAPAGLRRGRILTALDVEYSPTQGERDLLYGSNNAVNPIVRFPQDGIVVWGQRTLQRSQTALDRVNVRMLMIFLKKNLVQLLRNYIFEPNDTTLWRQVETAINPFMADVRSRRGVNAYRIICDATNNTPERIDRNELWVTVFVQPTKTVEFVALNLVVLRTGSSFSAEEILAAGGIVS